MTKNKNKKSSEAAKQEAFKLSDGICYCKTPEIKDYTIKIHRILLMYSSDVRYYFSMKGRTRK